jgi:hypothetical protein
MKPCSSGSRFVAAATGALFCSLILIACGGNAPAGSTPDFTPQVTLWPTPTSPATATAAPTATPVPEATPEAIMTPPPVSAVPPSTIPITLNGPAIAYGNVSFNLDSSLGVTASAQLVPEETAVPDSPDWDVHPQYTRFVLGYSAKNSYYQPYIAIYPVAAYESLIERPKAIIARLKQMLSDKPVLTSTVTLGADGDIPYLPQANAAQVFHARPEYLSFGGGSGVRFITQYAQAPMPVSNQAVFYTFQGLTADGQYYVAVGVPIAAAVLSDDGNPDAAGPQVVPFPANDMTERTLNKYFADVIAKLDALPPDQFTPSLTTLDALVQSMQVSP